MSDPETPQEPVDVTEVTEDEVVVRRAPRYGRFLLIGFVLGAITALVLTFAFPDNPDFDRGQVFGFLLLGFGAAGIALAALVALILDRVFSKRTRSAIAEHEATHRSTD